MKFASSGIGTLQECKAGTLLVLVDFDIDRLDKTNRSSDPFLHLVQFLLDGTLQLCTAHTACLLLQVGMEGSESCH